MSYNVSVYHFNSVLRPSPPGTTRLGTATPQRTSSKLIQRGSGVISSLMCVWLSV